MRILAGICRPDDDLASAGEKTQIRALWQLFDKPALPKRGQRTFRALELYRLKPRGNLDIITLQLQSADRQTADLSICLKKNLMWLLQMMSSGICVTALRRLAWVRPGVLEIC